VKEEQDMNVERLLKLAELLKTVPEEKFFMQKWVCGTRACALGHAAMLPESYNTRDFDPIKKEEVINRIYQLVKEHNDQLLRDYKE
jgi:hypothetical protein